MRSASLGRSAWRIRLLKGNSAAGFVLTVIAALAGCQRDPSADTQSGERVQQIRARGYLNCGVRGDAAGFSLRDANGKYSGLEADMCRALAGALLDNVEAVRFQTIDAITDFTQNRDLDVVFHGLTWMYSRARTSGLSFSPVVFYDGQTFLAPKNRGIAAAADLNDRSICVTTGSAAARYLQRYFQAQNFTLRALVVDSEEEAFSLLLDGQCDAMSADASRLASLLLAHPDRASGFFILPERISKEPLAGVTRRSDAALHDALTWTVYALVQAEELELTQANVDQVQAGERPDKDEFLQLAADSSGLNTRWVVHTIRQLGNYGEIYDRHLGGATAAQLPRGQNALWTQGGLMYRPRSVRVDHSVSFSRREFLQRTSTLLAARLTGVVGAAQAGAPHLQAARGRKPTLVVLGAGMAGLAAAYQWTKAGNACVVLEARDRVGGRNWTLRGGDRVPDVQGAVQECEFDDGLYFNCGAARIPSHHAAVLSLCHELGVPLEVQVNANRSAYLYNESTGGATLRLRRAVGDAQGRVAELLLQALVRGALDDLILAADKPRMIKFLRQYGDLSANNLYEGSPRAGFERAPGVASEGAAYPPLSMSRLLDLDMWNQIAAEDDILMQATMLQPVGGMDRIPQALAKNLGPVIRLNAEVLEIRRQASHARVVYRDRRSGETHIANADFCLSTIPPPVLKSIPADFSSAIVTGLATVTGGNARKIAFESQRFWERNDGIYGGLSYLENPYAAVWYPSHGFQTSKGILVHYGAPQAFDRLSRDQQVAAARRQIALLHPGRDGELRKPLVLSWNRIPFSLGVGAYFHDSGNVLYRTLNGGEPPFYFAGDYLSAVGPWQEGAVRSAYRALELIDAKRSGDAAALG